MFLKKETRKDFSNFMKAKKVEIELLKETNKFLENATTLEPLNKWYKRKFWYASPRGLLMDAEIKEVYISIKEDWVSITWYGTDWVLYDDRAFFDKETAEDMCKLVAWTYIDTLKHDRDFYKDMLERTEKAIENAELPPENKTNAELPAKTLSNKKEQKWTTKKSKKKAQ